MAKNQCAIFMDNEFGTYVLGFNIFSVERRRISRVIGAPIETGQMSFDNKVIDPFKVIVIGKIVGYDQDAVTAKTWIEEMYQNREFEFYSVSDGENTYSDLILESVIEKKHVEAVDFLEVELTYTQAMLIQSTELNGKNPSTSNDENSDFRSTGYQKGAEK